MGQVFLVGAGLGSVDFLTVWGRSLLESAEVVIYDALGSQQLLDLLPAECLRVYVGKRGGEKSTPQTEINRLLVEHAHSGKRVVRLKGGDPYIFGRSHPEVVALSEAGCEFEVVPGISSVLAAPLLAGIPLTHKELSAGFFAGTAHNLDAFDWKALAKLDTLVFVMGGRKLGDICQRLQDEGRSPDFPIAVVQAAGLWEQQVWTGTLSTITQRTQSAKKLSPCVIIVGQVVNLRPDYMSVISETSLAGQTILITRAASQSSEFGQLLTEIGANILEMPALEIREPSTWEPLDQAIAMIETFSWLILTSANGVEFFFRRLRALGKDARVLGHLKIAVVGTKTAKFLEQEGLKADFIPPDYVADSLVENFPEALDHQKILFPRVETGGRNILVKELTAQGATIVEAPAYESGCPHSVPGEVWQALQNKHIKIVTFASSKTVKNFWTLIQQNGGDRHLLKNIKLASIGPLTSQTCLEIFGRVDIEAEQYTLNGLRDAIIKNLAQEEKQ
ncbi:uroporphyrinogen-III C-methyltransferase [[Limnothrix rosea] IAM M-220]|uniref:uroporphyrinogen-III C-methyltransferase n=1 Tax=[Limnothrix rosea] IAM M-220 TaxID=454133 RepID=UPI00095B7EDD|nr:uroporphyrinogen-III C-methyltransferase [[Limnothrix rosea] IAM M-220]OKH17897.1 uroporphyrinogen-III C-methyltransferase [[Limnothrix rosea] IAM M-220]